MRTKAGLDQIKHPYWRGSSLSMILTWQLILGKSYYMISWLFLIRVKLTRLPRPTAPSQAPTQIMRSALKASRPRIKVRTIASRHNNSRFSNNVNVCFFKPNDIRINSIAIKVNLNITSVYSFRTKTHHNHSKIEANLAIAGLNSNHVEEIRRTAFYDFLLQKAFTLVQHRGHTLLLQYVLEIKYYAVIPKVTIWVNWI